ncbi:hypothetical protein B0T18DRAFT_356630 [Schizothecium vesticola]|uniref:CBM1 domain-containing protein n=1 Tax=Schizothecium vesticola TaxID=314040 RepID=A0AA40F8W8_9PEZI|nr:hypothetical protein B0T18DRAFT_356630 [Schizothecium vesticola]
MRVSSLPLLAATVVAQQAAATPYGQCGGLGFVGPAACGTGYYCTVYNPYYAQCVPGVQSTTIRTSTPSSTSTPGPATTTSTRTSLTITSAPVTSTPLANPGVGAPTTLLPNQFWIRAVATPNYRSYLQPAPTSVPTSIPAVLASSKSAAQFRFEGNQLVLYQLSPSVPLYMHVANSTAPGATPPRKLRTWFAADKNAYGDFAFQGDTLVWSVAGMQRPNSAAWLVCEGGEVFVNTGAFLYQTPEGCFDHTIHSYGGATADM